MDSNEIYAKALKLWKPQSQVMMAIEEMSELTKELCKFDRKPDITKTQAISEEMADVEIMLEQLKLIFINHQDVKYHKRKKLKRLEKIVKQGEN